MERAEAVERLAAGARALGAVLGSVDPAEAAWRPAEGKWSLVEIGMHLWDEEKEDFRVRVDYTLHRPGEEWPSIDPEGWVVSRNYARHDLGDALTGFLAQRERSLGWLLEVQNPDWKAVYEHPRWGEFRAGDILASWVAHDLLHLRQITRLLFDRVNQIAKPYSTAYAGPWPGGSE